VGGRKTATRSWDRKRESPSSSLASLASLLLLPQPSLPKMSRPLTANSRNEAEMMSKAKRQQTMAQDPLGMYSLSLNFYFILLAKVHFNFSI
jgi:hypothetical protein